MSYDLSNNLLSIPTPIAIDTSCRVGLREIPLNLLAYILSYVSKAIRRRPDQAAAMLT